ncbi:MAG: hypothetical protein ACMXYB_04400 [Candidatus Woesearchaeota archaeon]
MTSNNNFESTLRKTKQEAKKAVHNNNYTEFFMLNEQRRVIELLVTSKKKTLLEFYFLQLIPEEIRDFVNLYVKNDIEEEIHHWYFEDEVLVLVFSIDWGDSKQETSIEIDSEQFQFLTLNQNGVGIKFLDYKLCNEFFKQILHSQASMVTKMFQSLKEENLKEKRKENFKLDKFLD